MKLALCAGALCLLFVAASQAQESHWRGVPLAPENRCSDYDSDDYPYPQSVEPKIIAAQGDTICSPYTLECFASRKETDIEHIVARSEAHDSGLCAADDAVKAQFAADLINLTLASPRLNRYQKVDKDAADWLPEYSRCWFVAQILAVRLTYGLTIDPREAMALEDVFSDCGIPEDSLPYLITEPAPVDAYECAEGGLCGGRPRQRLRRRHGDRGTLPEVGRGGRQLPGRNRARRCAGLPVLCGAHSCGGARAVGIYNRPCRPKKLSQILTRASPAPPFTNSTAKPISVRSIPPTTPGATATKTASPASVERQALRCQALRLQALRLFARFPFTMTRLPLPSHPHAAAVAPRRRLGRGAGGGGGRFLRHGRCLAGSAGAAQPALRRFRHLPRPFRRAACRRRYGFWRGRRRHAGIRRRPRPGHLCGSLWLGYGGRRHRPRPPVPGRQPRLQPLRAYRPRRGGLSRSRPLCGGGHPAGAHRHAHPLGAAPTFRIPRFPA